MAKYKVGDKVRIVKQRPNSRCFKDGMVQYLGKTLTVSEVHECVKPTIYLFREACTKIPGGTIRHCFREDWITGLAEPKKPEFSISVHFHDRLTVAELIKDGKVVKARDAWCSPKDKYSMAEGARIAVERLFQKKLSEKSIHIGEMLIVTGNSHTPIHYFRKGTIVTVINFSRTGSIVCKADNGREQYVSRFDLKQHKEKGE